MTFFDPKEDVLDIQLTQYGRHMLSKGKMKPAYYAFFDEGVIYESEYAGFEEGRDSAENRIQAETPYLRTRHCFTGRDEFLFDGVNDKKDRIELGRYERLYSLTDPLGTSQLGAEDAPYYSLNFLDGEMKSAVNYMTGSTRLSNTGTHPDGFVPYSHQLLKIPQINVDVEFKVAVVDPMDPKVKFRQEPILTTNKIYKNGLSVAIGSDDVMILVEEGNTDCKHENFDIQVFEVTSEIGNIGEEILKPMAFRPQIQMVKDNLLLDTKEARAAAGMKKGSQGDIDSSFVDYFLNIETDGEISKPVVCGALNKIKKQGKTIYSPCGVDFDCPDIRDVVTKNIYFSDADPESCPD